MNPTINNRHPEPGRATRNLQIALVLLGGVLFFLFFGNGASNDPSLFSWIYENLTVDSWCVLVPLAGMVVLLFASKRFRHKVLTGRVSAAGALWVQGCGIALAVIAFVGGHPVLSYIGFWVLILGALVSFHGRGARTCGLLLLLALFSLPQSPLAALTPLLQAGTLSITKLGLTWMGIEFESGGTLIAVRGFSSRIAAECSGLRSMQLATALALLVSALYPIRWPGTLLLVVLSCILGAVGNLIRIFVVIGFGAWRGSEFAMSVGHERVGPAIGIVLLLSFFYFAPDVLVRLFSKKAGFCCENRPGSMSKQFIAPLLLLVGGALICALAGERGISEEPTCSPPIPKNIAASETSR